MPNSWLTLQTRLYVLWIRRVVNLMWFFEFKTCFEDEYVPFFLHYANSNFFQACTDETDLQGTDNGLQHCDMSLIELKSTWTGEIYFDPDCNSSDEIIYPIRDEELRKKMKKLVDRHEKILEVFLYYTPLSESLPAAVSGVGANHHFVVFRTDNHWWSIEKNAVCLALQRCTDEDPVLSRYRRKERNKPVKPKETSVGRRTMGDFINWLWRNDELNCDYHLLLDNCQAFATLVFDELTDTRGSLLRYFAVHFKRLILRDRCARRVIVWSAIVSATGTYCVLAYIFSSQTIKLIDNGLLFFALNSPILWINMLGSLAFWLSKL